MKVRLDKILIQKWTGWSEIKDTVHIMTLTLTYIPGLTYLLHGHNLRNARRSLSSIDIATVYTTYL